MKAAKAICLLVAAFAFSGPATAGYPDKPIRLVISAPSGTAPDLVARLVGPKLTELLGQPVIIESKSGANGNIAAGEVSRAAPDGYTLLMVPAGTMTANPFLYPKTAVTDLTPITKIGSVPFTVAVRPTLGVKTFAELVAFIRNNPGKINAATTANGSFPHLAAEMLKQYGKLNYLIVKHNGGAAAGTSVAGEHTDFVIEASAVLRSLMQAGKLLPLATTGSSRIVPELPTVQETGIEGYELTGWIGLVGPKGLPSEISLTIQKTVAKALSDPAVRSRLADMNFQMTDNTPEQFGRDIDVERKRLSQIIESAGLREE